MSDQPAVYSCPSCGALSKVDPTAGDGSVCGECGYEFKRPVQVAPRQSASGGGGRRFVQRDVVSRRRQVVREKAVLPPEREVLQEIDTIEEEMSDQNEDEVVSDDGHKKVIRRRKKRRRQASMQPYLLGAIWILALLAAFLVFRDKMEVKSGPVVPPVTEEQAARQERNLKMQAYISGHIGECRQVLNDFWDATDEAGRAQFVYASPRVIPSMYRHEQQHGFRLPKGPVDVAGSNLVVDGDLRMIETIWKDKNGERFEVAFLRDEGTWKIDWESYVRYSSTRWDVFVSGAIQTEGDFRVYMREKQLSAVDGGVHIGLKFYPPNYEVKSRRKGESPTVLVRADSELGGRVRAVLDGLEEEVEPGDSAVRRADPKGMARVRVLLEWRGDGGDEKLLYLNELKAGSWFAEEVAKPISVDGSENERESSGEGSGTNGTEDTGETGGDVRETGGDG